MSSSIVAQRQLANAFKKIKEEPVEGFAVELLNESNLFEWKIYLEGPKDSPYEGGIFQAIMKFPSQFPMLPPSLTFTSEFWHPNVYKDGKVCISILHPPGEDEMSGELPEERWLPTQTVGTILLSVISMLNDPNPSSAANVDASVQWRKNKNEYIAKCKKLVEKANRELPENVIIPHPDTNPEEKQKLLQKKQMEEKEFNLYDEDSDEQFYNESEDGENSAFYESEDENKDDDVWAEHPAENSESEDKSEDLSNNDNNNDNDNNTVEDIKSEPKEEKVEIKKEEEKKNVEVKKEGKKSEKVVQESANKEVEKETKKEPAEKNVEKPQESQPQPSIIVNKELLKKADIETKADSPAVDVPKETSKAVSASSDDKKQKKKKENCLLM